MATSGPVRVAVLGRPGCGRRTVARALLGGGVEVAGPQAPVDVDVYVLTETLKPEDRAALTRPPRPRVAILNKADLAGFGGPGPLTVAADRCRRLQPEIDTPILPLAALLAAAVLDDATLAALRVLTAQPANLGATDAFLAGEHPVSREVRQRLLTDLDLFGIAHAVVALREGAGLVGTAVALRRASGLDPVLAAIARAGASARYRRLADGASTAARMAAATQVVEADGMAVDRGEDADAHLRRAITWQRYSRGPVSDLHRRCALDIVRGSLQRWEGAGGRPEVVA
ncbi:MAG: hypothetical protein U0Q47_04225 [Mycobacterium sp.]